MAWLALAVCTLTGCGFTNGICVAPIATLVSLVAVSPSTLDDHAAGDQLIAQACRLGLAGLAAFPNVDGSRPSFTLELQPG